MTNFITRSSVYNQLHQELLRESMCLKSLFIDDLCLYLYNASGSHYEALSPTSTAGSTAGSTATMVASLATPEHSITKMKIAGFIESLRATLTAKFEQNQTAVYDRYMVDVFTDYIVVHMEMDSPAFTVRMWELRGYYKSVYGVDLVYKIPLNYQNIYLVRRNAVLTTL